MSWHCSSPEFPPSVVVEVVVGSAVVVGAFVVVGGAVVEVVGFGVGGGLVVPGVHEAISSANCISINVNHDLSSLLINAKILTSAVTSFVTEDSLEQSVSLDLQ